MKHIDAYRKSIAVIDEKLLEILVCPETREPVEMADAPLIENINKAIAGGKLKSRNGEPVSEAIDGGLVRKDGKFLYPIRDDIPIMLIEEAIPLPLKDGP